MPGNVNGVQIENKEAAGDCEFTVACYLQPNKNVAVYTELSDPKPLTLKPGDKQQTLWCPEKTDAIRIVCAKGDTDHRCRFEWTPVTKKAEEKKK